MPTPYTESDGGMIMECVGIAGPGFRDYKTITVQGKVETSIAWTINEL